VLLVPLLTGSGGWLMTASATCWVGTCCCCRCCSCRCSCAAKRSSAAAAGW
jgi:hypothetical protein